VLPINPGQRHRLRHGRLHRLHENQARLEKQQAISRKQKGKERTSDPLNTLLLEA
jgi:hypothetical protein